MSVATEVSPTSVAESLTGRPYLSFSAISTYRGCPLRFYFRYVERLPEEIVSASLVFGSAIHAALQFHYEQLLAGNATPDLDTLLSVYQETWNGREEEIRFGVGEDVSSLSRLAERMLLAFLASDHAQPKGRIIGIEEELTGTVDGASPDLLARVDLIVEEEESLVVRDFKTSRSRWSNGQLDCSADQLLLYHELAKPLADGKPLRLEFLVLTKTKAPELQVEEVAVDSARLQRTRQVVKQVWRAIEAGHFYPSPSPLSCPTCPFREPCRAWCG